MRWMARRGERRKTWNVREEMRLCDEGEGGEGKEMNLGTSLRGEEREDASATSDIENNLVFEEMSVVDDRPSVAVCSHFIFEHFLDGELGITRKRDRKEEERGATQKRVANEERRARSNEGFDIDQMTRNQNAWKKLGTGAGGKSARFGKTKSRR